MIFVTLYLLQVNKETLAKSFVLCGNKALCSVIKKYYLTV